MVDGKDGLLSLGVGPFALPATAVADGDDEQQKREDAHHNCYGYLILLVDIVAHPWRVGRILGGRQ